MSMSTNPRFIKRTKVDEDHSATIKPAPRGFPVLVDDRDTGYAPTKEVTIPPCTHPALFEKVKEPAKGTALPNKISLIPSNAMPMQL